MSDLMTELEASAPTDSSDMGTRESRQAADVKSKLEATVARGAAFTAALAKVKLYSTYYTTRGENYSTRKQTRCKN